MGSWLAALWRVSKFASTADPEQRVGKNNVIPLQPDQMCHSTGTVFIALLDGVYFPY